MVLFVIVDLPGGRDSFRWWSRECKPGAAEATLSLCERIPPENRVVFSLLDLSQQSTVDWVAFCGFSVTQSCATLQNPMDYSTSGFPVSRHLPEFAQLWVALDKKKKKKQRERLSPTLCEVLDPAVPETALILSWTVEFHEPMIPNPHPPPLLS